MFSLLIPALLLQLNGVTDCNNAPQLAERLLKEASRLGIQVIQGAPECRVKMPAIGQCMVAQASS